MTSEYAVAPVAPAPGLNQLERVVDTFVAPSKTFADILRSTSWWLPLVLMIVLTTASNYVIGQKVGWATVSANALHATPSMEERINNLPPDQKDAALARSVKSTEISTYLSPVFLILFFLLYSLIIWASFNFGLGASTKYSQVLAVAFYSALPYLLVPILSIITLYVGNNQETFDLRNQVGTNLGYYLPDLSPVMKVLLASLDAIKIWADVLMALGMAIIAKKSFAASAAIVFGYFVLGILLLMGVAAAFS